MTVDLCLEVRELLALRVSNDLEPDESMLVDQHVRYCRACREELERHEQNVTLLREAGALPTPVDQSRSLWERIEPQLGRSAQRRNRSLAWVSTRQLAAACIGLFLLTLYTELRPRFEPHKGPAPGRALDHLEPVGEGNRPIWRDADLGPQPAPSRSTMGVLLFALNDAWRERLRIEEPSGALVLDVIPGSGADLAGIRNADILLSVNGRPIRSPAQMMEQLRAFQPGEAVRVELLRQGRRVSVVVRLRENQVLENPQRVPFLGNRMDEMPAESMSGGLLA